MNSIPVYCSWVPQTSLFSNFFIKNRFHYTVYTFKNYFITVFLVSVFNFSKNKLNPNEPLYYLYYLNYLNSIQKQTSLFSNFFIKNGFHYTIHAFKNYFATVFLVSIFNFSKNKLNPNKPLICISLSALGLFVQGLISTSKSVVLTDQCFINIDPLY